jgi:hypothetical protein
MQKRLHYTPLFILLIFLFIYVLTGRGRFQNVDELAMLATLTNFMEHRSLAINELSELNEEIDMRIGFMGPDGNLYSKYAPGNIIFAAGFYQLGAILSPELGTLMALYLNPFLGAISLVLLYIYLSRHFKTRTAIVIVVLTGLCTDWWFQARGFGLETGAGMLLLGSLLLADSENDIGSAACFGGSLFFRTLNAVAWPVWALSLRKTGFKGLRSVIVIILFGLGLLGFNWIRYHSFTDFGYNNVGFSTPLWIGLSGLLFSPGRSIFLYSPIFLLIFPGAWLWFRRDRYTAVALTLTITAYIVFVATWVSWDSGWSWGSRLLTPVAPLMAILIAPVVEMAWAKSWLWIPIAFMAICGFGIEILAMAKDPMQALKDAVMSQGLSYEATLYTVDHSWLALQWRSLSNWSPKDLDAFILRLLLTYKN